MAKVNPFCSYLSSNSNVNLLIIFVFMENFITQKSRPILRPLGHGYNLEYCPRLRQYSFKAGFRDKIDRRHPASHIP
jgi:hypothetical protein